MAKKPNTFILTCNGPMQRKLGEPTILFAHSNALTFSNHPKSFFPITTQTQPSLLPLPLAVSRRRLPLISHIHDPEPMNL